MKKVLLILGFTILFGCSDDDDNKNSKEGVLTCGSMTITKIEGNPNKVMVTAYGIESEADILVEGKTFKDITCDNTLEYVGMTAE